MKSRFILILLIGSLFQVTYAQDSKIAVLDMTKLFEKHPKTAPAIAKLNSERAASSTRYRDLSSKLKATLQTHQEQIRANKKTAAVDTLKIANELEKQIATMGTKEYRDMEEKFRQEKLAILKAIRDSVRNFNKDGKYALILDLSAVSPTGLPQVVDSPGCVDITEQVQQFIYQGK